MQECITIKHKYSTEREREKSAFLSEFRVPARVTLCVSDGSDYSASDSYFHCICKSTLCSKPNGRETVLFAALKGEG